MPSPARCARVRLPVLDDRGELGIRRRGAGLRVQRHLDRRRAGVRELGHDRGGILGPLELATHARLSGQYQVIEKQTLLFFAMAGAFLQLQDYVDLHVPLIDAIRSGNAPAAERIASDHNTIDGAALVNKLARREKRAGQRSARERRVP